MRQGNQFNLPAYLKAKDEDSLRALMLENNVRLGDEVRYTSIQYANGYWFAWYYVDISLDQATKVRKKK